MKLTEAFVATILLIIWAILFLGGIWLIKLLINAIW